MSYILISAAVVVLFTFMARSIERNRKRERAAETARTAKSYVMNEHGLDDVFVSDEDGSLIGLSATRRILVLGGRDGNRVTPFDAIRSVEGLRDGIVLVSAERGGTAAMPAGDRDSPPPQRVRTLTLRITFDGPEPTGHSVLFLDGGKHGLEPLNRHLHEQAALTEAWYRRVVQAMRSTAS